MVVQPIDYFLIAWFVLAAISTAYDQFKNNPEPTVAAPQSPCCATA
jgi:hypothetical protein